VNLRQGTSRFNYLANASLIYSTFL